jgi:hypothetical protein
MEHIVQHFSPIEYGDKGNGRKLDWLVPGKRSLSSQKSLRRHVKLYNSKRLTAITVESNHDLAFGEAEDCLGASKLIRLICALISYLMSFGVGVGPNQCLGITKNLQ